MKARRRLLIATLVVLLALVFDLASGGMVRGAARVAASAVWSAGSAASGAIFGSGFFSSKRGLEAKIEALQQELTAQQALTGRLEVLERENTQLRAMVNFAKQQRGVAAPIVSSSNSSPYGTFLIGAGTLEGVAEGSIVLAGSEKGFVIGSVAEAGEHISLVREVFAPGALVEGLAGGAVLSLEGRGGGNARTEVPSALALSSGEPVTSTAFAGRVIGIVGSVSSDPGSALARVFVRVPVSLSELQFVYVVPRLE